MLPSSNLPSEGHSRYEIASRVPQTTMATLKYKDVLVVPSVAARIRESPQKPPVRDPLHMSTTSTGSSRSKAL